MCRQIDGLLDSGWDVANSNPIELRRVRTLTASAYLFILLAAPFLLLAYWWQIKIRMVTLPSAMLLMAAAVYLLHSTKKLYPAVYFSPLGLYVGGAGAVITSGGIGSLAIGWWLVVPMLAGLLMSLRAGLFWGVLVIVSLAFIHYLETQGVAFPDRVPPQYRGTQVLAHGIALTGAVLILMTSYLSQMEHSERTLKRQNSELKREIDRAEQAEEDAQRAVMTKNRFLANMSHELRTPLNSVLGFSQRLNKHAAERLEGREKEALSHIINNGHRMLYLVDDLLDLSQIEAGTLKLSKSPVELQQALDRACRDIKPIALQAGIDLNLLGESSVQVVGDGQRIVQILISILSHSVKFAGAEGIEVELGNMPQGALVQVRYHGSPLTEEEQQRLFDRYNHLHSRGSREVESSGLALPLARELVALHGGSLTLRQDAHGLICFNLFLPEA